MKILICSKLFYPSNSIGAVRPSNFAKYLAQYGHNVTIVTKKNGSDIQPDDLFVIRTDQSRIVSKIVRINQSRLNKKGIQSTKNENISSKKAKNGFLKSGMIKLKNKISQSISLMFLIVIDMDWYFASRSVINKKFGKNHFDLVISSYGPLSSALLGIHASKSGIAKNWIADFRDNMVNEEYPGWTNLMYRCIENKIIKRADIITFVSNGQKNMFVTNHAKKLSGLNNIQIIYNGYEEAFDSNKISKKEPVLRLCYTGQLYAGKRDLSMLFRVIGDLINESMIDKNKIEFVYAGPNSTDLKYQLKKDLNLDYILRDFGFVERKTAIELQNKSDLLIALSWNTKKEQGILTGKFLEYLQSSKPIISLTTGDLPDSELSGMITRLNLGIACEYCTYEIDYASLKKYIYMQYLAVISGLKVDYRPDWETIKTFHYPHIVTILNSLCEDLVYKR